MKPSTLCVVLPFHTGDYRLALKLLQWIVTLDGQLRRHCLLICSPATPQAVVTSVTNLAAKAFRWTRLIHPVNPPVDESWPRGANWLFTAAIRYVQRSLHMPFLWLEPDSVPMREGWLERLESEYENTDKLFMGAPIDLQGNQRGIAGVAVYPKDTLDLIGSWLSNPNVPFDVAAGRIIWPMAHVTPLIYHWWGSKEKPPTFREYHSPKNPDNTLLVDLLPSETVLYHRVKDFSLLDILERRLSTVAA